MSNALEKLQKKLGHTFSDSHLLARALTHRSYLNEHPEHHLGHNERLEFLGDSIIEFTASYLLYSRLPELTEGFMTRLRAGVVRTETLADFGREFRLGEVLLMAKGEEDTGGRDRLTNLCDTFEAVIGALFLDGGIEAVRRVLIPLFEPVIERIIEFETDKDSKSLFQEWSQEVLGITPVYRTIYSMGGENDRIYTVEVLIGDEPVGWGNGRNKQIAEQTAAKQALRSTRVGLL
jgi:ribonuclease-3